MALLPFENIRSVYPLCEYAVTVEFGNAIDGQTVKRIAAFNSLLISNPFPGLYQTVPAYASLTVFFDPSVVIRDRSLPGNTCFEKVRSFLAGMHFDADAVETDQPADPVIVPVCYAGGYGPDIAFVAEHSGINVDELIRLHCEPLYTVAMIGFIPGFAYLTGLDERLATPRKATPRRSVPAGSVGVGGVQTGVYSLETPGGWQIIGQTPLQMFSARRGKPALLKAGDLVRFTAITPAEFEMLKADEDKNT